MIRRLFFADNEKMLPNAENLKKSTKNIEELNLTEIWFRFDFSNTKGITGLKNKLKCGS